MTDNNNVLMRRDGRQIRNIPQTPNELTRKPVQDGFTTHLHCRWCDAFIKEVYIPALKDGKDGQPIHLVFDYEPCPKCRSVWDTMVIFIEVTKQEPYPDCLPVDEQTVDGEQILYFPTGKYVGVTLETVHQFFRGDLSNVKLGSVIYLETETFQQGFSTYFA